ncbi:MAG: hypothetical protein HY606_09320 [Planctomycetes bacterium]|nr:hypothetical protein [Planctomycetota bacterium]
MINVFILTEGGAEVGYGHISRCLAVAQSFTETRPEVDVKFIVRVDRQAKDFLKSNNINFLCSNWLKRLDRIQKLVGDETIIIVDSYRAPANFYKRLHESKCKPYVVAIDDYNRLRYEVDAVVNLSVKDKDSVGYKKRRGIEYLVGNKYLPLRKEFRKSPNKRINKKIKNILVSFGGTNCTDLTIDVINLLSDYDFNVHVTSMSKKVRVLFNRSKVNIHSNLNAKEMCLLMQKTDLCISGGGQVLNELAYLGVPTIAVCLAQNQIGNIKRWKKTGFLEYIGWHHDKNLLKKITDAVNKLTPYRERVRRSKIGKSYVDGNGALRLTEWILGKSASHRQKGLC